MQLPYVVLAIRMLHLSLLFNMSPSGIIFHKTNKSSRNFQKKELWRYLIQNMKVILWMVLTRPVNVCISRIFFQFSKLVLKNGIVFIEIKHIVQFGIYINRQKSAFLF